MSSLLSGHRKERVVGAAGRHSGAWQSRDTHGRCAGVQPRHRKRVSNAPISNRNRANRCGALGLRLRGTVERRKLVAPNLAGRLLTRRTLVSTVIPGAAATLVSHVMPG